MVLSKSVHMGKADFRFGRFMNKNIAVLRMHLADRRGLSSLLLSDDFENTI